MTFLKVYFSFFSVFVFLEHFDVVELFLQQGINFSFILFVVILSLINIAEIFFIN